MKSVFGIAILALLAGCSSKPEQEINPDYYLCNHVGHMKGLLDAGVVKAEPEYLKAKEALHQKFDGGDLAISKELCTNTAQNAYVLAYNTMKNKTEK